jgi:antitoxin VapB
MGPWERPPEFAEWFHGLRHNGELVAVLAAGQLIRATTCGGLTRAEAFELGRVCAARRNINRAALRLWREFVAPAIAHAHGYRWVISYQDAKLHKGDLYRFDGWKQLGASRSGTDQRSGRKGRSKIIWGWEIGAK